jgi:hypothetical protein
MIVVHSLAVTQEVEEVLLEEVSLEDIQGESDYKIEFKEIDGQILQHTVEVNPSVQNIRLFEHEHQTFQSNIFCLIPNFLNDIQNLKVIQGSFEIACTNS